jgi:hypothetical protein
MFIRRKRFHSALWQERARFRSTPLRSPTDPSFVICHSRSERDGAPAANTGLHTAEKFHARPANVVSGLRFLKIPETKQILEPESPGSTETDAKFA